MKYHLIHHPDAPDVECQTGEFETLEVMAEFVLDLALDTRRITIHRITGSHGRLRTISHALSIVKFEQLMQVIAQYRQNVKQINARIDQSPAL